MRYAGHLQGGSVVAGIVSAVFWFWSAAVSLPSIDIRWDGGAPLFAAALKHQSNLSAVAAICAGVAVLLQAAVSRMTRIHH